MIGMLVDLHKFSVVSPSLLVLTVFFFNAGVITLTVNGSCCYAALLCCVSVIVSVSVCL